MNNMLSIAAAGSSVPPREMQSSISKTGLGPCFGGTGSSLYEFIQCHATHSQNQGSYCSTGSNAALETVSSFWK